MSISIQKAETNDFPQIHQLIMEFAIFIKKPEYVSITPEQMAEDRNYFNCLIALDEGRIIGFATYFFAYYSWTGRVIYLDDLYVAESYRGAGIGNRLFDAVYDMGQKEGCRNMKWQVSNWNNKAIGFYKQKGATIDDVEINCNLKIKDQ
jgi:GNAT superfamily N-acetyltransferase